MPGQTPSQTVGPFFAYGLTPELYGRSRIADGRIAGPEVPGEHILVTGRVLDGEGQPVPDAMLELWQADSRGRFAHPAAGGEADFYGFGRVGTDDEGRYRFETVKPGPVPAPDGRRQAPHLALIVTARGLLGHLFTRIYFADEEEANAADPVLARVPEARRRTLLAAREPLPGGALYRFDIHLQGENETVFFDL